MEIEDILFYLCQPQYVCCRKHCLCFHIFKVITWNCQAGVNKLNFIIQKVRNIMISISFELRMAGEIANICCKMLYPTQGEEAAMKPETL